MKAPLSAFLRDKRAAVKELVATLSKEFAYASVLATDVSGKRYTQTTRESSVRDSELTERGFVARIYDGETYLEYAFSDWNPDAALGEIRKLANLRKHMNLPYATYPLIKEEALSADFQSAFDIDPNSLSEADILARLDAVIQKLQTREQIVEIYVSLEPVIVSKLFVSTHRDLLQSYVFTTATCTIVAADGNIYKENYRSFSGLQGLEVLNALEQGVDNLASETIDLLQSERIIPGEYDIICDPDVSGLIAHEAFGHGVEMDMFVKNRAKGKDYVGQPVASPITNMRDGAKSIPEVSSYFFDDEGVLAGDTHIIEDGILKTGICDQLAALRLGVSPTGNGKREYYSHKAYTRMTNTFFEAGSDSLESMIASIEHGYLLEGMDSGMEDPKNWGIQCALTLGREIRDGKLTGKIVSPVILTGYVPDLLASISMISPGVKMLGGGYCGKGYKEWVKTSTGGPYIKARGRLG